MTLKERLQNDLTSAMKNRDERRVSVLRLLRSAIRKQEIDRQKELSDEEVLAVLQQAAKQHQDSINAYRAGQRFDLVAQEEFELSVIQSYLPQPLSLEELQTLIAKTIEQLGATGLRDLGKVMGAIMPQIKGRADGSQVQALVRAKLGG